MLFLQVTQYECGDEMGGPAGCLQYFTTEKGTIRRYSNFFDLAQNFLIIEILCPNIKYL